MEHYGQVDAAQTLRIYFTTNDKDGGAVAPNSAFEAADVRIYKDGSATQRTTEAGYTMVSPFDSVVSLHLISIDLSDNTDAGFYAAGSQYAVILIPDETVDTETVVRVLAEFKIGPVAANVTQNAGTAITSAAGIQEVKVASIAANAITATAINADAITNAKIADDAIAVENIKDAAITAAKYAANAITSTVIADNAITANKIAAAALTAAKFGSDAFDAVWTVTVRTLSSYGTLVADVAAAVWAIATATLSSAGTIGKLIVDNLNATVSSRATPAQVNTECDTALADAGVTTTVMGRLDVAVSTRLATTAISLDGSGFVTVVTNNDKTGYAIGVGGIASTSFAAGAITATAIAADAIGASELAQDACREIADEVLDRNLAGGGSGNTRNVRNALRSLRNRVDASGGVFLQVYAEDDVTLAWQLALTRAAVDNIVEVG